MQEYVQSGGDFPLLAQLKLLDTVSFCKTWSNTILQKRLQNLGNS